VFNILKKHACIYIVFYNVIYITVGLSKREERKLRVRAKTLHGESYYLACLDAECSCMLACLDRYCPHSSRLLALLYPILTSLLLWSQWHDQYNYRSGTIMHSKRNERNRRALRFRSGTCVWMYLLASMFSYRPTVTGQCMHVDMYMQTCLGAMYMLSCMLLVSDEYV